MESEIPEGKPRSRKKRRKKAKIVFVSCPGCRSERVAESRWVKSDKYIYVLGFLVGGLRPFRCKNCHRRFWRSPRGEIKPGG